MIDLYQTQQIFSHLKDNNWNINKKRTKYHQKIEIVAARLGWWRGMANGGWVGGGEWRCGAARRGRAGAAGREAETRSSWASHDRDGAARTWCWRGGLVAVPVIIEIGLTLDQIIVACVWVLSELLIFKLLFL